MTPEVRVALVREPMDTRALTSALHRADCGAVVTFEGRVRSPNGPVTTLWLDYEAYEKVALAQMRDLAASVLTEGSVKEIVVVHRLGRVAVGEPAFFVGASSPHRHESFAAVESLVERVKQEVAIWKLETTEEGAKWSGLPAEVQVGGPGPSMAGFGDVRTDDGID